MKEKLALIKQSGFQIELTKLLIFLACTLKVLIAAIFEITKPNHDYKLGLFLLALF
jgi:hypothetical protein